MTTDLDARGRAAGAAVRAAFADVPLPDRRPVDPHRGPDRRPFLVAAALVAVAGLVAVVLATTGGDDDRTGVATDVEGGVPRLVVDAVPHGMEATGAADLPLPATSPLPSIDLWVYGGSGDEPFVVADLGIARLGALDDASELPDGPQVPVGERRGVVLAAADSVDGRTSVFVEHADGTVTSTSSASLDEDELLAVAAQVDHVDGAVVLPADLPDGLELRASAGGLVGPSLGLTAFVPGGTSHVVGYQDVEGRRHLSVHAAAAGDDTLLVLRWAIGAGARPVDVRGVQGWLTEHPFGTSVLWQESPGVAVLASGGGLSPEELLDALATVRQATDDEWAALLDRPARPGDDTAAPAIASVSGDLADGSTWTASVLVDGSVTIDVGSATGGRDVTQVSPVAGRPSVVAFATRTESGEVIVYGVATGGILRPDMPFSEAHAEDGTTVFAGSFGPDEEIPTEVVVVDPGSGDELGRAAVGSYDVDEAPDPLLPPVWD